MTCLISSAMYRDVAALYANALPVFAAIAAAFLSGLFTGIGIVIRFFEVKRNNERSG